MLNYKTIFKAFGTLLLIEASLMFYCLVMSFCYGEDDVPAFLISIVVTMLFGFLFRHFGVDADGTLNRRDAYFLVTLSWIAFSAFGTLPFLISGYLTSFTDAYFEAMSGFTSTGASVIDDVEALPHGLLFWRSFTQWIGGLGIVFFTIALLPSIGGGSVKVFAAEATGPVISKLHPRLRNSAKSIWVVYIVLTLASVIGLMICGMDLFNAVNFSMASTATGGFTPINDTVDKFVSPAGEYVMMIICLLSGVNFSLLYLAVVKRKLKALLNNTEMRFYLGAVLLFSLFIMLELLFRNHYSFSHAIRSSLFQVISLITTTGFIDDQVDLWPHVTWIILGGCMFLGGCAGSTAGGIKIARGVMILKVIRNEFKQMLHPNAVLSLRMDGVNLSQSKRVTVLAFIGLYIILSVLSTFVLTACGTDFVNSVNITLSCIGNAGPSLNIMGPPITWSSLSDLAKWLCSFLMLVGRLELFTVMVLFTPSFWKRN